MGEGCASEFPNGRCSNIGSGGRGVGNMESYLRARHLSVGIRTEGLVNE